MTNHKKPTFSEIVAELRALPPKDRAKDVRPGTVSASGDLWDPEGRSLAKAQSDITPNQAQQLLNDGAKVAFESCGCGGGAGCEIEWLSAESRARLRSGAKPAFVKGHGSPTWIDYWKGADEGVVLAHGDVRWGSEI